MTLTQRPLTTLVLTAALLFGQWLVAGHDRDLGLQAAASDTCTVCAYASGAASGVLPSMPSLFVVSTAAVRVPVATAASVAASRRQQPIRGPPIRRT